MIITILIFIVILGILVFVHEFGHFIVAKKSGMQVEEFGFGFPPRIAGIQKVNGKWRWIWAHRASSSAPTTPSAVADTPPQQGGDASTFAKASADKPQLSSDSTIYSINSIPLGGFVRILGENNESEDHPGSFINKGFWPRFFTLIAGVVMNVILAWVILSAGYMVGLPVSIGSPQDLPAHANFSQPQIAVFDVSPGLPAAKAGIIPNDMILKLDGNPVTSVTEVQSYVNSHEGKPVIFNVKRGNLSIDFKVTPNINPPAGQGATGISLALVGKLKYPFFIAIWQGAKTTVSGLAGIFSGLYTLFTTKAGVAGLGGPVKIAKLTGQVAGLGFVYLMQFTAFLSLNLAVLNILPFPALDGGRVAFLIIEKIRRKRNSQKVEQIVNAAGFVFLILLMIVVTVKDIWFK